MAALRRRSWLQEAELVKRLALALWLSLVSIGALAQPAPPPPAFKSLTATFSANGQLGVFPTNTWILFALFRELAGHDVTVQIGTTPGAFDVMLPQFVKASTSLTVSIGGFATGSFPGVSSPTLYVSSPSWGSPPASVEVEFDYKIGP